MSHHVVFGAPVAKGRPRVTAGGHAYTPDKTRKAEATMRRALKDALPFPTDEPLLMVTVHRVPIPKSWPKAKQALAKDGGVWPIGRPDVDNYFKLVADAANELLYADDGQVVAAVAIKAYSITPCTEIWVRRFTREAFHELMCFAYQEEQF